MMDRLWDVEGPVISFLNKTGQLIGLSVLWLVCSVPLVTIPAATTALYYAVAKTVRHDAGSAGKEFFRSLRANLLRGMVVGLPPAALAALLLLNLRLLGAGEGSNAFGWAAVLGLILLAASGCYICPILSRFTMKAADVWKLAFVMSLRFWHCTLVLLLGTALGALAQFFLLPIPALAVMPGAMCLAATWPVEKALRHYMPPKEENSSAWYDT